MTTALDRTQLRRTLAAFPTGLALIGGRVDQTAHAMLANSFTSVSLDPPMVSMAFTHQSSTWVQLRQARELAITIMGEPQAELVAQLRLPNPARLDGIELESLGEQAIALPHAAATLLVRPHRHIEAGDHELVLFDVLEHHRAPDVAPLAYLDHHVTALHIPKALGTSEAPKTSTTTGALA